MSGPGCCCSSAARPWERARLELAAKLARLDAPELVGLSRTIAPPTLSEVTRAGLLLEAVQAMTRYELRGEPSRPLQTWARGWGSCGDSAPLLASLAAAGGIPARLVYQRGPARAQLDHLACQLFVGGAWWWAEPTLPGAQLGEAPQEAARRLQSQRKDLA